MPSLPLLLCLGAVAWFWLSPSVTSKAAPYGTLVSGWNLRRTPNTIGVGPGWYRGDDGRPYYWPGN